MIFVEYMSYINILMHMVTASHEGYSGGLNIMNQAGMLDLDMNRIYACTLQGISISHLGKREIIFKMDFSGDMLVSRRVIIFQPQCLSS